MAQFKQFYPEPNNHNAIKTNLLHGSFHQLYNALLHPNIDGIELDETGAGVAVWRN